MRGLANFFKDDRGATAVEYALIMAMVFLAAVTAMRAVGTTTIEMWNYISTSVLST